MSEYKKPENAEKFQPEGATVPFYKYSVDDKTIIEFDSSLTQPPEPMVNAMTALNFVDPDTTVVMINHKKPMGLFGKIGENYNIDSKELDNGNQMIVFSYKDGKSEKADLTQTSCGG